MGLPRLDVGAGIRIDVFRRFLHSVLGKKNESQYGLSQIAKSADRSDLRQW